MCEHMTWENDIRCVVLQSVKTEKLTFDFYHYCHLNHNANMKL